MVSRLTRGAAATAGALVAVMALASGQKEPFAMVSMEDVEKMLGQPDVFVVDANPEEVFRKNHLPGARWWKAAPLAKLLPAEKDRKLVFYCASPT